MKLSLVVASCALLASLACAVPYGPFFYGMPMEYRVPRYPYPISGYGRPVDPYYDGQGYPMEYYDGRRFKSTFEDLKEGLVIEWYDGISQIEDRLAERFKKLRKFFRGTRKEIFKNMDEIIGAGRSKEVIGLATDLAKIAATPVVSPAIYTVKSALTAIDTICSLHLVRKVCNTLRPGQYNTSD
ncbi:hypothetical protein QR680_010465 [Steinernema hermaphroditum]|uniref:SXP/RAL-2 family protein Ani s 5-like cation-binding domain-containing protein n=1 Tax=Steinernema hermaphroditum TaxID=289476 RepID=A0AA39IQN9_9BILA|nr:hypothetical protein QR680_010465 [Steinernema hermaphroditum]